MIRHRAMLRHHHTLQNAARRLWGAGSEALPRFKKQVTCIVRNGSGAEPHQRISHIGGPKPLHWKIPLSVAIAGIKSGEWIFYALVRGKPELIIVARGPDGHEYIKTLSDGEQPSNLLALPDCPD